MTTTRSNAPQPPGDRRPGDNRTAPAKPKRRTEKGPIGFSQVMRMVKREKGAETAGLPTGCALPGAPVAAHVAATSNSVGTLEQRRSALANQGLDTQTSTGQRAAASTANQQTAQVMHLGAMTPQQAAARIEEAAKEVRQSLEARELHIELEPAHLGPLVVRLQVDRGLLRAGLVAKREEAAKLLDSGASGLKERLDAVGFARGVDLRIEHDEDLELTI